MANFFSLQDGNLLDSSVYGTSLSGTEITSNTTGTMLLTSSLYSTNIISTNAETISALAFNLSARSATPSGNVNLTIQTAANAGKFIDSSSNSVQVNPVGTPTQSNFTPFSPNGWSGSFPATADSIAFGTAANWTFLHNPSAKWTMECYLFVASNASTAVIFQTNATASAGTGASVYLNNGGVLVSISRGTNTLFTLNTTSSGTVRYGVWNHIAVTCDLSLASNNVIIYINGSSAGSGDILRSAATGNPTNTFTIGGTTAAPNFYISNFRLLSGVVLYNSNFTPSTSPLTNIANTVLLTLQDSRFIDNSNNNFTLTATGSPAIKDTNPFTPVLVNNAINGGAGFFGGSSSISTTGSTNYEFSTTTSYTIEFWFYPTVLAGAGAFYRIIYYGAPSIVNGNNISWGVIITSATANRGVVNFWTYTGTSQQANINSSSFNINTWNHYALVNRSGSLSAYLNGVLSQTISFTNEMNTSVAGAALQIGIYNGGENFRGYLSNIRLVKGAALYTTNFTPSTSNLTNVNNTVFLLNTNNYGFKSSIAETYPISSFTSFDGSSNLLTNHPQNWQILKLTNPLTANNLDNISYRLNTTNPNQLSLVAANTAVDAAGINRPYYAGSPTLTSFKPYPNADNSWRFNGSTDWISVPANINFTFDKDFTIEFWINTTVFSLDTHYRRVLAFGSDAANNLQILFLNNGSASTNIGLFSNAQIINGTIPVANGIWHHVAVSRYNNALRLYVDGIQSGDVALNTTNYNAGATNIMSIGSYANGSTGRLSGAFINDFRVVNGTAVYTTSSFSPPSAAPLEYIPNTVFLLKNGSNFNQAVLTTNTYVDALTATMTNTNTVLSTASPFGTFNGGSISFNGTNSFLRLPTNTNLTLGGDFTIDFWANTNPTGVTQAFFQSTWDGVINGVAMWNHSDPAFVNRFSFWVTNYSASAPILSSTTIINGNTWYHVAVTRSGNDWRLFVNGNLEHSRTAASTINQQIINIGKYDTNNAYYLNGCIANLRIIKGTCLYINNFSVPTSPSLLLNGTSLLLKSPHSLTNYLLANNSPTDFHIGGALKGSTVETRTVAADSANLNNLYIHNRGTVNFPLTSSKTLIITGPSGLQITSEGTLNIGTSSSMIPLSTTHTLVLSNTQIDVHNGGNLNVYGFPETTTTNLVSTHPIGSRVFTVTSTISNNWRVGDILAFKPNLSARTSFDTLILSSFTEPNTFTTTSNSLCTHTGSADAYSFIPDVYNLTRNVNIRGISPTARGTIRTIDAAKTNMNYAQLSNFGINLLTEPNKNGIFVSNNSNGFTNLSANVFSNDSNNNILIGNDNNQYSVYFNGSNAFTAPNNAAYCTLNSDFTIECWFFKTSTAAANNTVFSCHNTWATQVAYYFSVESNNVTRFFGGDGGLAQIYHQTVIRPFTWYHVAVVRKSGVVTVYIDGVPSKTKSTTNATFTNPAVLSIGQDSTGTEKFNGYISNFRIIKGVALYSDAFNPADIQLPLNNTPNTTLLLFQNRNHLVDSSVSNVTLTPVGVAPILVNRFNPIQKCLNLNINKNIFYKSSNDPVLNLNYNVLSNSTINDNYILSSSGTGLQISNSTGRINMSNNIIVGSWGRGTSLFGNSLTGSYGALNYNSGLQGMMVSGTNTGTITGGSINSAREGVYVDASTDDLRNVTFQNIIANNNSNVGFKVSGNNLNYLTPVILNINGLTANNNNFDAGFEAYNITGNISSIIANNNYANGIKTSIGNGPTVFDGLTSNTVNDSKFYTRTPYTGTFQTSAFSPNGTNTSAFISGGASLYNFGNTSNVNLAAGNFTIEFWIYPTSPGAILTKDDIFNVSWPSYSIAILTNNRVEFGIGKGVLGSGDATDYQIIRTANNGINLNQWSHVAAVNSNALNAILLYVNGVMTVSATKTATMGNGTDNLFVGGKSGSSTGFVGNLYNLRITKSVLYTSNFTPSINYALIPNTSLFLTNYNNTYLSYLSTYNPVNIISAYNYNQTIIKNADIFSPIYIQNSVPLSLNNINKLEEFRLENCKLSSVNLPIPLQITSVRPRLEGSYLFDNCNSDIYGLSSLALTGYQSDTFLESGIVVMRENGLSGNHYKLNAAGKVSYDSTTVRTVGNYASEKLQPTSATIKLRSGSKYIPISTGQQFTVSTYIYKSAGYTGAAPRLILVGNSTLGFKDTVLATSVAANEVWEALTGIIPASLTFGTFEVYVDCSGSLGSGTINIDDWDFS